MSVERQRRFAGCDEFVLVDPDSMEPLERFEDADAAIFGLARHAGREDLEIHGVASGVQVLTIVWGAVT